MNKLEKIAFWIILAVVFLLPVAFLSPTVMPLDMLKASLFSIGTSVAFLLVLIGGIHSGKITWVKGVFSYSALALIIAFTASGLAASKAGGLYKVFWASGTETTTVLFAVLAVVFVYTVVVLVRTKERVMALLTAVMLSGLILGIFHTLRLVFGADTLALGNLFSSQISNTVGQWNDLGLYLGFILLLSYIGLELMTFSKSVKILLYIIGCLALVVTVAVGFASIWYALILTTIAVGLYTKKHLKLSPLTIGLFAVFVLLAIFNTPISERLSKTFNISQLDVRPSWELSADIANQTLSESPIFGVGPNRYVNEYLRTKSATINQTVFWSVDFYSGVSYISSFPVMLGGLGILAILFVLFAVARYMYKTYRHTPADPIHRFVLIAGAAATLYTIVLGVLFTPSLTALVISLVAFALFLIGLHQEGLISYGHTDGMTPRKLLLLKIIGTILAVITLLGCIYFIRRAMAAHYYQGALVAMASSGNIEEAEKNIDKAIAKVDRELYLQGKTELVALKISRFIPTIKEADQKTVDTLKGYLEDGVTSAHTLINLDKQNYQNYIAQARIYESVIPAKVAGAYDNAMKSYASAAALNPGNPSIYLSAAQIEVAMNKLPEAKGFIGRALQVKNNYSDAIFLLSQIQVSENSIKDAITSLLVLAQLNPQDPTIFFQLGLLYYNESDNVNTGLALSKAVELNPEYSNARYFLGLALARLGKYPEAAAQFEAIQKFNPDNAEIDQILVALRAGRSPFQAVNSPEKAKTPPVKDTIDKKTTTKVKTR